MIFIGSPRVYLRFLPECADVDQRQFHWATRAAPYYPRSPTFPPSFPPPRDVKTFLRDSKPSHGTFIVGPVVPSSRRIPSPTLSLARDIPHSVVSTNRSPDRTDTPVTPQFLQSSKSLRLPPRLPCPPEVPVDHYSSRPTPTALYLLDSHPARLDRYPWALPSSSGPE